MKKTFLTLLCAFILSISFNFKAYSDDLLPNQLRYRSALISLFPDGYDMSLEDMQKLLTSLDQKNVTDKQVEIKIESNGGLFSISLLQGETQEEKKIKTGVHSSRLALEINLLLNNLEGLDIALTPSENNTDTSKDQQGDPTPRTIVYRNTKLTLKGNNLGAVNFKEDTKPQHINSTTMIVVMRNNKGDVFYKRKEDNLLRSLNRGLPLDQVKAVVDGFIDAL